MYPKVIIHSGFDETWLSFKNPVSVVQANDISEVIEKLTEIDRRIERDNLYAAGFVSYEAAPAFDRVLCTFPPGEFPLLWFGLYEKPEVIEIPAVYKNLNNINFQPSISREEYYSAIEEIKKQLRDGHTYQVNYTFPLLGDFSEDPWNLFLNLVRNQQSRYGAYLELDRYTIASISPELFFALEGNRITSIPMKGTRPRGRFYAEDLRLKEDLQNSVKDRAENSMIVDMIRNDLGRISEYGSVKTEEMYGVEKYPTVWQMVSRVTGKTNAAIPEIFKALFPCASITGAPKVSTMRIINKLEKSPRKIYTGSIGFITPKRRAQFNVAIRTVLIDKKTNNAEYGIGGGIVWDSIHIKEYEECFIKARALTVHRPKFRLFESILWNGKEGYFILDYHLRRMRQSADYFNFEFNEAEVSNALNDLAGKLDDSSYKIRVLLSENGKIELQSIRLNMQAYSRPLKVKLAKNPVNSEDIFLYHKTTNRDVYDQVKRLFPDYDEMLFFNEKNEITEFTNANVVVKMNGNLYTPPVECGLLAGTCRQYLLDQNQLEETIIRMNDIENSQGIFLINSVRKIQHISLD